MRIDQGVKAFYRNYEKIPQNGRNFETGGKKILASMSLYLCTKFADFKFLDSR